MWLYLWALMASWLIAVDRVGRHAGSWSYIQGSTRNHENKGKTNNLGYAVLGVCSTQCMLVLGVNSWSWDGEIERDDLTLSSAMMVEVVDEKERDGGWRWERCGGYEQICKIRGTTCLMGLGRPRINDMTCQIGTRTCRIGDGKLTVTRKSLKSQFPMMICPISSHLSPSRPQIYHHLRTRC